MNKATTPLGAVLLLVFVALVLSGALCALCVIVDYKQAQAAEESQATEASFGAWVVEPSPTPIILDPTGPIPLVTMLRPTVSDATGEVGDVLWNPKTHTLKIRDAVEWITVEVWERAVWDQGIGSVELNLTVKPPASMKELKYPKQGPQVFLWEIDNYLENIGLSLEELQAAKIQTWGTPTPTPNGSWESY